jgi:hypothetical protein
METELFPTALKIIVAICCVLYFVVFLFYKDVLDWLGAGAKHSVKLMLAGGKYMAKAMKEVEEYLTRRPKRPKAA